MPEDKYISLKPVNEQASKYYGCEDYLTVYDEKSKKENYIGHLIKLPVTSSRFELSKLPIFIHEFTHVLNSLFTPKYSSQAIKTENMYNRIIDYSKNIPNFSYQYDNFYAYKLYCQENFTTRKEISEIIDSKRKELIKLLKNRTPKEKIAILQNFRYFLQSEKCAYNSEQTLYTILRKYGLKCDEDLLETDISKYLLDEKIQMLKDLCYQEIQKVRSELR